MTTKKEILLQEVAKAVGAAKNVMLETVDFNDPNCFKTCLEVDLPILFVNQVAGGGPASQPSHPVLWARYNR